MGGFRNGETLGDVLLFDTQRNSVVTIVADSIGKKFVCHGNQSAMVGNGQVIGLVCDGDYNILLASYSQGSRQVETLSHYGFRS